MSDLKPKGIAIHLNGEERHLLFTLNSIIEIQDHYDLALSEVINKLMDQKESAQCMRYLMFVLLNDECERAHKEDFQTAFSVVTEKEVGAMIAQENYTEVLLSLLKAYGISLPESKEEDNDPNQMSALQK